MSLTHPIIKKIMNDAMEVEKSNFLSKKDDIVFLYTLGI